MLIRLFRFLSLLPLPLLHGIGVILGLLVYGLSPTYRRRLRSHITFAGFQSSLPAAIREAGKNIMELPFAWCASTPRLKKLVREENWAVVQRALEAKKGLIFLTPHIGCFEIVGRMIALHQPISCLYRPPRKAALKPLLEDARIENGIQLAPANLSGVRILLKALKRGEAVGVLPDQVPQEGEGVWADFFGKPAYTMTLSAKLHTMTGAPIILTFAERLPFGAGYIQHYSLFDEVLEGTLAQQAAAINRAMEKMIARCPAQYFWSYHRYKKPDGVVGPESVVTTENQGQA